VFLKANTVTTDILIIGAGGAGLFAAIQAAEQDVEVLVTTKGPFGKDGAATWMAGWGFNAAVYEPDSPELHAQDTLRVGQGLNNEDLVIKLTANAPNVFECMRHWGVRYFRHEGMILQNHLPGHTYARTPRLARPAGMGGLEYRRVLPKQAKKRSNIKILDDFYILEILQKNSIVCGAVGFHLPTGEFQIIKAKVTVLAAGGMMGNYRFTSASPTLTGDGLAMAFRAGVELIDMEFADFYTNCVVWPPLMYGDLDWIANLRYDLRGIFYNKKGDEFLRRQKGSLISIPVAIQREIQENRGSPHGGVYLSFRHLPGNLIDDWFAEAGSLKWVERLYEFNIDIKRNAVEVAPAPLESLGGCRVNSDLETNIPGLLAAGEVAGGCEGAYTLAGNPICLYLTTGYLAGLKAANLARELPLLDFEREQGDEVVHEAMMVRERHGEERPISLRRELQELLDHCGHLLGRNEDSLTAGIKKVRELRERWNVVGLSYKMPRNNLEWLEALQLKNSLEITEVFLKAALSRKESRGLHYREDYPEPDPAWIKNIVLVRDAQGNIEVKIEPVHSKATGCGRGVEGVS
jgi:succinate dehydrogenase/fumarate reductase flavoprotein subunit